MTAIRFAALAASASSGTEPLTSFSDKLSTGLTVFALGMVTVFAVLAILWAILALFKVVFYHEKKPAAVKAPKPAPAPAAVPAPAAAPATESDDGALVAAITAAIAAYTANDESFAGGFRVVSFRRSSNASPWNKR